MKMPKQIKVGRVTYTIQRVPKLRDRCGFVDVDAKVITLATGNMLGRYSAAERANTFWHEVTHAILYEIGDELWANERHVNAFANRLEPIIRNLPK